MSSTEPGPPQRPIEYKYPICQCSAELLPSAVNPSLEAIFALSAVALSDQLEPGSHPYGPDAYRINMPPLRAARFSGSPLRELGDTEQGVITNRAKQIVAGPYRHEYPAQIDERELLHIQLWLDGIANGVTEQRIARRLRANPKHIITASRWLRHRLDAVNQPSAMYGALLHGYTPDVTASPLQQSPASSYESLHFYLDEIGFTASQAAGLTRPGSDSSYSTTVSGVRSKIVRDFGAGFSGQAAFFAFETGYFKHLTPPQQ